MIDLYTVFYHKVVQNILTLIISLGSLLIGVREFLLF